jgi:hypothetical protein
MIKNANRDLEQERENRRNAAAGRPVDGGQQPPSPPAEPPAGAGGEDDGLDDDERAEMTAAELEQKFRDITGHMSVLASESDRLPKIPLPVDAELLAMGGKTRIILERLVLARGPLMWGEMHALLCKGGDWGPAAPISTVSMGKLLKKPNSKEPVDWLLPRGRNEPYDHRDRQR